MGVADKVIRGVASAPGILSLKLVWKSWSLCIISELPNFNSTFVLVSTFTMHKLKYVCTVMRVKCALIRANENTTCSSPMRY